MENNNPAFKTEDSQETITEIQNYLHSFNEEIQDVQTEPNSDHADQEIFVSETGEYYFENNAPAGHVLTVVNADKQTQDTNVETKQQPRKYRSSKQKILSNQAKNNATVEPDKQAVDGLSNPGPILLGEETYQTVTLVPTGSSDGEVSYVLIVQQPEGEGEAEVEGEVEINRKPKCSTDEQDMTVFDFEDVDESVNVEVKDSADEDDKSKIVKLSSKRSQCVIQQHMCNYCNYTSSKRYLLSRHLKSHSEERPHKCSVCDRGFKTIASLQNHVNTHTGIKPHGCKFCPSAFTTSGELVRHVRYKHTHEKPHKCTICEYASVELSKMRNHMRCHTGERPYQCNHCTYASPDSFKLKRHLRIHTGEKPYECDICHSRFTQSNSLKAHKLIHYDDSEKPVYKCEHCPATCGRKTDLRIHVQKLHTSDRVFICSKCGKMFQDRYSYKVHTKTHDGEKCWKCDLCPYASIAQRHLEAHMLVHTDQKPFRCALCDQSFRQKQLLKRHQNLYHDPNYVPPPPKEKVHECPECKRSFRHKGNLIRHMYMHDPSSNAMASALKQGRQKRIPPPPHDIEDVKTKELEDDDKTGLGSQVIEASDGQHYVVLEVIQLQGSDGDQTMAVVSDNYASDVQSDSSTSHFISTYGSNRNKATKSPAKKPALKQEIVNNGIEDNFGFVSEVEDDD